MGHGKVVVVCFISIHEMNVEPLEVIYNQSKKRKQIPQRRNKEKKQDIHQGAELSSSLNY